MKKIVSCIRSGGLTLATMSGVIGGVVFGLVLRSCKEKWSDREVINWAVIGQYHITWLKTVLWLVNDSNTELWLVKILGDVCILCWRDIPEDAEGSDSPTYCTISDHCSGILGYVFVRCEKIFKTFKVFLILLRSCWWESYHLLSQHHWPGCCSWNHSRGHSSSGSFRTREGRIFSF